jgi:glutaredoxin
MLELYQAEGCPYSQKVREALTDLGVSYVIHNPRLYGGEVRNEQTLEELLKLGG